MSKKTTQNKDNRFRDHKHYTHSISWTSPTQTHPPTNKDHIQNINPMSQLQAYITLRQYVQTEHLDENIVYTTFPVFAYNNI